MAWSSDLVRTKNWSTEILTDADLEGQLDLIINWVMALANETTGHKHDATENEGPKIATGGIANDAITFALIDDDGDFGLFTGDWSFNEIALVEDTAPSTAASEGKIYTKDTGGQPEIFFREESNGDEVQITKGGKVKGVADAWVNFTGATATVNDSFNVDSVTRNSAGNYTITWTTDFADTNYCLVLTSTSTSPQIESLATGTATITNRNKDGTEIEATTMCAMAIGTQ